MLRGALGTSSGPWDKEWASVSWEAHAAFSSEHSAWKTAKAGETKLAFLAVLYGGACLWKKKKKGKKAATAGLNICFYKCTARSFQMSASYFKQHPFQDLCKQGLDSFKSKTTHHLGCPGCFGSFADCGLCQLSSSKGRGCWFPWPSGREARWAVPSCFPGSWSTKLSIPKTFVWMEQ